jgi:hypothetical protein
MKKIIVIILATVAITATALIAVPALAKDATPQAQATVQAAAIAIPVATTATNSLYMGYGAAFCGGGLVMNDTVTLKRVAVTLGITYDQLVKDLQNGQTIAAIAAAQKVDLSKVIDTVVAAQTDMVNVLVKYGYITQDQANTIIADLRTRVENDLSATVPSDTTGYGYGCFGAANNDTVTPVVPSSGSGYGYGMMGGAGLGMMGW